MGRIFNLSENETYVLTEILAGVTMFLTMVLSGKMFSADIGMGEIFSLFFCGSGGGSSGFCQQ
jgi:xanthine/uracil/vitamin C permease (AzgA family)